MPFWISFYIKQMLFRFSFILQHRETGEIRYHHASHNIQLLNSPKLILNQQDLYNLLGFLISHDFPSQLKDRCPKDRLYGSIRLRANLNQSSDIPQQSQTILTGDRLIKIKMKWVDLDECTMKL